jgi:hypothetical protein
VRGLELWMGGRYVCACVEGKVQSHHHTQMLIQLHPLYILRCANGFHIIYFQSCRVCTRRPRPHVLRAALVGAV